jgi:hypothetical protein
MQRLLIFKAGGTLPPAGLQSVKILIVPLTSYKILWLLALITCNSKATYDIYCKHYSSGWMWMSRI